MSGILGLLNPFNNPNRVRDINTSFNQKRRESSTKQSLEKYAAIHCDITDAYKRWVERMKDIRARKIVYSVKKFIADFLAKPVHDFNEDGRHTKELHEFLTDTFRRMCKNDVWRGLEKAELENTFESLERYVMVKLYTCLFPNNSEAHEKDDALSLKINVVQFIKSEHLDIPYAFMSDEIIQKAGEELCRIDLFRAPCDKMICLLNCCKIVMDHLKCFRSPSSSPGSTSPILSTHAKKPSQDLIASSNGGDSDDGGASFKVELFHNTNIETATTTTTTTTVTDNEEETKKKKRPNLNVTNLDRPPSLDDFLPILIYVVIKSRVPHLYLNTQYILHCRSPSHLKGEPWYYLTNLCSAISFIQNMDHTHLSIGFEEYNERIKEAEDRILAENEAERLKQQQLREQEEMAALEAKEAAINDEKNNNEQSLRNRLRFLHTKLVDLKFGDIPKLLSDYKRLATTLITIQRQDDASLFDIEDMLDSVLPDSNNNNDDYNNNEQVESEFFY